MMKKKLKIAVTGGIGSGKSTVCDFIKSEGFPVIYADDISKEILSSEKSIQKKIIKEFGEESFIDDKPNVEFLSEIVFSDPQKVKNINSILHPPTIKKIEKLCEKFLQQNNLVFVEAALIYEAEMEDLFDYILLVAAPEEDRINRTMKSKGLDHSEVVKRIKNQLPEEKKKKLADFVIENSGTIEELKSKINFVLLILKSMIK